MDKDASMELGASCTVPSRKDLARGRSRTAKRILSTLMTSFLHVLFPFLFGLCLVILELAAARRAWSSLLGTVPRPLPLLHNDRYTPTILSTILLHANLSITKSSPIPSEYIQNVSFFLTHDSNSQDLISLTPNPPPMT